MQGFNRVLLIGNLGADPDVRTSAKGGLWAKLSLATNRVYTDSEGVRQEETQWHRVVVFRKTAEICQNFLRKGSPLAVEGRLHNRSWLGEDGARKYSTEVVGNRVVLLPGRRDDSLPAQPPARQEEHNDDIPF